MLSWVGICVRVLANVCLVAQFKVSSDFSRSSFGKVGWLCAYYDQQESDDGAPSRQARVFGQKIRCDVTEWILKPSGRLKTPRLAPRVYFRRSVRVGKFFPSPAPTQLCLSILWTRTLVSLRFAFACRSCEESHLAWLSLFGVGFTSNGDVFIGRIISLRV